MKTLRTLFTSLALLLAPALHAATIHWTTSTVSGPADVRTTGALLGAMNVGSATAQTVNGVAFAADPGGNNTPLTLGGGATVAFSFGVLFDNFWSLANPGGNAAYAAALDAARYNDLPGSGTVTLGGLVAGSTYQVQLWIVDTRPTPLNTRVRTVQGSEGPQVNMLQLREVPFVVTTAADEFDTPSGPNVSLREALRDAAASPGAGHHHLRPRALRADHHARLNVALSS